MHWFPKLCAFWLFVKFRRGFYFSLWLSSMVLKSTELTNCVLLQGNFPTLLTLRMSQITKWTFVSDEVLQFQLSQLISNYLFCAEVGTVRDKPGIHEYSEWPVCKWHTGNVGGGHPKVTERTSLYYNTPHNDVLVSDRSHMWQCSQEIISKVTS